MRRVLIFVASFFFVLSLGTRARSQETDDPAPIYKRDQTLINDVEPSPARKAAGSSKSAIKPKPAAAKEGGDPGDGGADSFSKFFDVKRGKKKGGDPGGDDAIPKTLSEALAKALQSNPAVLLAEAKLRQADAEYNQVKLQTVQDVTVAFHQWIAVRPKIDDAHKMNKKGYAANSELQELTRDQIEKETKLAYLLGVGAELHPAGPAGRKVIWKPIETYQTIHITEMAEEPAAKKDAADKGPVEKRPEIPEKYREILQKPVKVEFENSSFLSVIQQINQATSGKLAIIVPLDVSKNIPDPDVNGDFLPNLANEAPLHTVLEMVADVTGCVFVFRDYGLLVVPSAAQASNYRRAAKIPEGGGY